MAARCRSGIAASGRPKATSPPEAQLAKGELKFTLARRRGSSGSWVLVRMRGDRCGGGKRTNWLLIKHRDDSARPGEGDAERAEDKSVASGRPMEQIAAGKGRGPPPVHAGDEGASRKPDAVWQFESKRREAADGAAPTRPPRPRLARAAAESRAAARAANDREAFAHARLHPPAACAARRPSARRRGLGT